MPIHDYECTRCGGEFEFLVAWDEFERVCPKCKGVTKRVYKSFKGIQHDAPDYLKDTLEVVDKESGKRHCEDFLKRPTRSNYKAWMKGEGIRPMDEGEKVRKVTKKEKEASREKRRDLLQKKFRERESISI